jgi:hypothetical protein
VGPAGCRTCECSRQTRVEHWLRPRTCPPATLGVRGGSRTPLWGTVGLGWLWYSGTGPNSNGPALSARARLDLPIGSGLALSPYAGYLTMLGHDGPRTLVGPIITPDDPGVLTRVASLQLGVAVTVTP